MPFLCAVCLWFYHLLPSNLMGVSEKTGAPFGEEFVDSSPYSVYGCWRLLWLSFLENLGMPQMTFAWGSASYIVNSSGYTLGQKWIRTSLQECCFRAILQRYLAYHNPYQDSLIPVTKRYSRSSLLTPAQIHMETQLLFILGSPNDFLSFSLSSHSVLCSCVTYINIVHSHRLACDSFTRSFSLFLGFGVGVWR